jgi:hypothetical protein
MLDSLCIWLSGDVGRMLLLNCNSPIWATHSITYFKDGEGYDFITFLTQVNSLDIQYSSSKNS